MAIRTVCPNCRKVYALADHLVGKTVRCKECGDAIPVRAARGERETGREGIARERMPARSRQRIRDDDEDFSRPIRRSNRGLVIGLIACGVALILLLGGGTIFLVFRLASRAARLPSDVVVEIDDLPPNADAVTKALVQVKSANQSKRMDAVRKLKEMLPDERRAEVVKALEPLINDTNLFIRKWAVEAIGVWGDKNAVPILLKAMRDKETRGEAMMALARLKDERAVEPIAERLEEFFDRHDAEEALKAMGPMAEKAVLARLNHHDWQVRIAVCQILAVIGTKESIPALEKAVAAGKGPFAGENFHVAGDAERAINAIKARQQR